ncbi:MAG: GntR family transcriptional regulator [Opitutus sp.]
MQNVGPAPASTTPSVRAAPRGRIKQVEHANLDRKAHQILKDLIVNRRLVPGEKIPQEKLAADLGVSRTPLVNALKLLEKENLVESRPRRGYYVRAFDTREMIAVFELREVLEGLAARKAAEVITPAQIERLQRCFRTFARKKKITDVAAYAQEDEAFHSFLIEIAGHHFLREILEAHDVVHASYQTTANAGLMRPPAETINEHLAIIEAVCTRSAAAAERSMRRHLANTLSALHRQLATEQNARPATTA